MFLLNAYMSKNLKSVITCDLDGKIETFSEGAQELFGFTEEEIIGKGRVNSIINFLIQFVFSLIMIGKY